MCLKKRLAYLALNLIPMKSFLLFAGILFASGSFASEKSSVAPVVSVKAAAMPQQFGYFRAHRMANDAMLTWSVSNPMEAQSFTIFYSYDGQYFYELETIAATGSPTYRYRDVTALPGVTFYKIVAQQKDMSTTDSPVESVRIVKRG